LPEVVSAGKDTFIVSHSGGIYTQNSGPIRADVFRAANEYCARKGLVMVPIAVDERPYVLGRNTASVRLTFLAVSAAEAEKLAAQAILTPRETAVAERTEKKPDLYLELTKLDDLRKRGLLTEEEFLEQKKRLLEK
jgi:hypothetical protein